MRLYSCISEMTLGCANIGAGALVRANTVVNSNLLLLYQLWFSDWSPTRLAIVHYKTGYYPLQDWLLSTTRLTIVHYKTGYCPIQDWLLSATILAIVHYKTGYCPLQTDYCPLQDWLLSTTRLAIVRYNTGYCPLQDWLLSTTRLVIVHSKTCSFLDVVTVVMGITFSVLVDTVIKLREWDDISALRSVGSLTRS